jgi:hypothetical protein
MKDFIESFDFIHMKPDNSILQVSKGNVGGFHILALKGYEYAIYLENSSLRELTLQLPDGEYMVEWINPLNGEIFRTDNLTALIDPVSLACPEFQEDLAIRIILKTKLRDRDI